MSNFVILVNEQDQPKGIAEKLWAHQQGLCHRAFSVFIVRRREQEIEVLLQQRATHKYHSPALWTNTCCSHPAPGESVIAAAERRLQEELNLKIPLQSIGAFHYRAEFENGLTEDEFDHVLVGWDDEQAILPNAEEVMNTRWIVLPTLQQHLQQQREQYTYWLAPALDILMTWTKTLSEK